MGQGLREKLILLAVALVSAITLSIGHLYTNQTLLWGTLVLFLGILLFSDKEYFLPLMLFYLPWSPILKTSPDSFTFFTLVVPVVFFSMMLSWFRKGFKLKTSYITVILFFSAYTLLIKLLNEIHINMSYIFFIMMLLFIPMYAKEYKDSIRFESCTIFLVSGVLSACIASELLMDYPHMLRYIDVYKWENMGLTRLSGFYGDANYYAAQILVAVSALLVVLSKTRRPLLRVFQFALVIALLYFGMKSVSKMFMVVLAVISIFWIFGVLIEKRSISYKLGLLLGGIFTVAIVILSNTFFEQINQYLIRFRLVTDINSLLTGRGYIYEVYIHDIFSRIDKFLFGIGFSDVLVDGRASHNTLIQIVYQVGIIGFLFFAVWWKLIYYEMKNQKKLDMSAIVYMIMVSSACFLPWLALDILEFDEFFYFTLLAISARNYLSVGYLKDDIVPIGKPSK